MSDAPLNFPERSALLALMTFVVEVPNPDIRARYGFSIDGEIRSRLKDEGYIDGERDGSRPGRPFLLHLEEKGWRWCREQLDSPPGPEMPKNYRLLYGILNSINFYLQKSGQTFDDFFGVAAHATETHETTINVLDGTAKNATAIEDRIRSAYQELVSEPGGWVGLRRLRERLADVGRTELDEALLRLGLRPEVYLEREMNQKSLTDDDWAAAIRIGGEPKHLLSIDAS
jgi:hypothetical protein